MSQVQYSAADGKLVGGTVSVLFGSDPELFLANESGIIGAEKVIPKEGLATVASSGWPYPEGTSKGIVLDGVQVELHPPPAHCRQTFSASLAAIFSTLNETLKKSGATASFEPVVQVSKKEMDTLSDSAKALGCMPSLNAHNASATVKLSKRDERVRSAGGHIHLGSQAIVRYHADTREMNLLASCEDILVGLPCVMIDRDPHAAKRRKVYGRAGEYRLPSYGFEYRTLSNFWLRHYHLLSFVLAQARTAVNVWVTGTPTFSSIAPYDKNTRDELLSLVDMKQVAKAINTNSLELAAEEWAKVKPWIAGRLTAIHSGLCTREQLEDFEYFAAKIQEHGLSYWFPEEPMVHWTGRGSVRPGYGGFESFLASVVHNARVDAALEARRKAA